MVVVVSVHSGNRGSSSSSVRDSGSGSSGGHWLALHTIALSITITYAVPDTKQSTRSMYL